MFPGGGSTCLDASHQLALVPDYLLGMIRVEMCREYGPSDVLCDSCK